MKEIINELNNLKIIQKSTDWLEDLPENVYQKYFYDKPCVEQECNIEEHRHYELAIDVYRLSKGYIGIIYVSKLYSEQSSVDDIFHTLKFVEMEPLEVVTYKIKK